MKGRHRWQSSDVLDCCVKFIRSSHEEMSVSSLHTVIGKQIYCDADSPPFQNGNIFSKNFEKSLRDG